MSEDKNDGAVTVGGNRVEMEQVMDEINNAPDKTEEAEVDHRSDEDKNAEGYAEIIKEWKGDKQEESDVDANADTEKPDTDSSESKEDTETKTEPKEEKADDVLPVIPEVLRRTALEFGVTSDEIQKVKSVDELSKIVETLKNIQPEKVEEKKEPEVDPLDEIKLDPEEYEESLITAFDGLKDMVRGLRDKNKTLEDDAKASEEFRQVQIANAQADANIKSFDGALSKLDNKELFGEGDATTMDVESDAFQNRSKLYDEVEVLGHSYYTKGKEVPDVAQLIKTAGLSLFGDKFDKKKQVKEKLEERSQNLLGKPSQREIVDAEPTDKKAKAVSAVGAKLKEWGLTK